MGRLDDARAGNNAQVSRYDRLAQGIQVHTHFGRLHLAACRVRIASLLFPVDHERSQQRDGQDHYEFARSRRRVRRQDVCQSMNLVFQ